MVAAVPEAAPLPDGFLALVSDDERTALLAAGRRRTFGAGDALFTEGDRSDHVILVLAGRVKVASTTADGREVLFAVLGPGELLGELSALDKQPRSASVIAVEPVEAVAVTVDAFERFLADHPSVPISLLRMVSRRLRDADRQRAEFSEDSRGRLARRLLELAERFGEDDGAGTVRITLPLSQDELAAWVGSSREAVARGLRTLRARGWIETQRRRIVIRDLPAVRREAGM
jgi:CRP-like cAMP-binding protein